MTKKIITILLVLVLTFSFWSCANTAVKNTTSNITTNNTIPSTTTPNVTIVTPNKNIYSVGDKFFGNFYTLEVESIKTLENSNGLFTPSDGHEYIEVVVVIENLSDKELAISSLLCFDAYVDDFSVDLNLGAITVSEFSSLDGTLTKNKKLKGVLCYELPINWQELQISVDIVLFDNNKEECVLNFTN